MIALADIREWIFLQKYRELLAELKKEDKENDSPTTL